MDPDITSQLKGKAEQWYWIYAYTVLDLEEFLERVLGCFDSPAVISELHVELYGVNHQAEEPMDTYLLCKMRLMGRLQPQTSEIHQ